MDVNKDQLLAELAKLELDWGDEEDALGLVELLLEQHSPLMAWSWLCWYNEDLDGLPIVRLREGKARDVFAAARRISAPAST